MCPYRRLALGICRLATLSLLILVSFRRIFLALFQEPKNFPEQHFVFQIDLIIQIGPQPVLCASRFCDIMITGADNDAIIPITRLSRT